MKIVIYLNAHTANINAISRWVMGGNAAMYRACQPDPYDGLILEIVHIAGCFTEAAED